MHMKKLKITLGGKTFTADVFEKEAPRTVAALESAGAFDSVVFAANVCSNEITWNTPCGDIDYLENEVIDEDPGNVVLFPSWGAICVFFGPTEPVGWCTKFAKIVDEDLDGFSREAEKVWYKQGGIVRTEFVEEDGE